MEAAKRLGISQDRLRSMADRKEIAHRWRGGQRLFPIATIEALASKKGITPDGELDAIAFDMMEAGDSDQAIVTLLRIPLARVERLRAARGGELAATKRPIAPLAKTARDSEEDEAADTKSKIAVAKQIRAAHAEDERRSSEWRQQMLRRRKITG